MTITRGRNGWPEFRDIKDAYEDEVEKLITEAGQAPYNTVAGIPDEHLNLAEDFNVQAYARKMDEIANQAWINVGKRKDMGFGVEIRQ